MIWLLTMFLAFSSAVSSKRERFSCLDLNNKPVDWYTGYKLPELKTNPDEATKSGYGFLYMDINRPNGWLRANAVNRTDQALAYTLQQIYRFGNRSDVSYLMYNDEHPNGDVSFDCGHTKGVLLFDDISGFWLIHSVPKFPAAGGYLWPNNARYYGQHALCVSFNGTQLPDIARQLLYDTPWVYSSHLPKSVSQKIPDLTQVIRGKTVRFPPYYRSVTLTSAGGLKFRHFAKSRKFDNDLYFNFVAPSLGLSMDTETWQHGATNINSSCNGKNNVYNIRALSISTVNVSFDNLEDHSKYAVSTDKSLPYVCIGDINRQYSQYKRGGGTMCFMNSQLWKTYNSSISDIWPCSLPKSYKWNALYNF